MRTTLALPLFFEALTRSHELEEFSTLRQILGGVESHLVMDSK